MFYNTLSHELCASHVLLYSPALYGKAGRLKSYFDIVAGNSYTDNSAYQ